MCLCVEHALQNSSLSLRLLLNSVELALRLVADDS